MCFEYRQHNDNHDTGAAKRMGFGVKVFAHFTRNPQIPIKLISPSVVWARKYAPVALLFQTDPRTTMTADI